MHECLPVQRSQLGRQVVAAASTFFLKLMKPHSRWSLTCLLAWPHPVSLHPLPVRPVVLDLMHTSPGDLMDTSDRRSTGQACHAAPHLAFMWPCSLPGSKPGPLDPSNTANTVSGVECRYCTSTPLHTP